LLITVIWLFFPLLGVPAMILLGIAAFREFRPARPAWKYRGIDLDRRILPPDTPYGREGRGWPTQGR
jgi:hypothetical protein